MKPLLLGQALKQLLVLFELSAYNTPKKQILFII